ncbi:MAG: hypothetical protein ACLR8H_01775 [Clostridium sp.]|jgi:hypothetical protein
MERADVVNFFIKRLQEEGMIDIEEAVEFYQFADWLNENLEFEEL